MDNFTKLVWPQSVPFLSQFLKKWKKDRTHLFFMKQPVRLDATGGSFSKLK